MDAKIGEWYDYSALVPDIERATKRVDKQKKDYKTRTAFTDDHNYKGFCGEATYSVATGLPVDWTLRKKGDCGWDFEGGVQVKATPHYNVTKKRGYLIEFLDPEKGWARYYVLVAVALDLHLGMILGWQTGKVLRRAKIKNFGYGDRRAIHHDALLTRTARDKPQAAEQKP